MHKKVKQKVSSMFGTHFRTFSAYMQNTWDWMKNSSPKWEHTKDYDDKETKISTEGSSFFLSSCRRVKSALIFKKRKKINLPKEACFKIHN